MIKNRTPRKVLTFVSIAVLVAIIGVGIFMLQRPAYSPVQPLSDNAPSSVKPSQQAIDTYKVAPELPKYIRIPTINVPKTRVMQLGLLKNNQIAAPNNIYDAGWYRDSTKPGQHGAMFMYGHVSSWSANGIFYDLKNLKPGDYVTVERGDGKSYTYAVNMSKTYPADKVDMHAVLAPTEAGKPGLNLMTCAGQLKKGSSEFSERLVVFTTLIESSIEG